MELTVLDPSNPSQDFPAIKTALKDPDGLLALGGCLSPIRLIKAYKKGIFPWYNPGEPILWWSPDPRLVLFPNKLNVSRSLKKSIRKNKIQISYDQNFSQVMQNCASPRQLQNGTWITQDIYQAYTQLHDQGIAHSFEGWFNDELVGGLYGVAIGQVFFGESMFHKKTDASKIVFYYLVQHLIEWGYQLIDCQVHTNHLSTLGAEEINRNDFVHLLEQYCAISPGQDAWNIL